MTTPSRKATFESLVVGGLVAVGVVAACAPAGGLLAAIAAALGGVGGDLAASAIEKLHSSYRRRLSGPQGLIANHDLRRAVATTVGQVMLLVADEVDGRSESLLPKDLLARARAWKSEGASWLKVLRLKQRTDTDRLRLLAFCVTDHWDTIAQRPDFEQASEGALNNVFAVLPADISNVQPISATAWKELLVGIDCPPSEPASEPLLQAVAERLESHFVSMLREVIKEDFETGGKAFAAVHLNLIGEVLALSRESLEILANVDSTTRGIAADLRTLTHLVRELSDWIPGKASAIATELDTAIAGPLLSQLEDQLGDVRMVLCRVEPIIHSIKADTDHIRITGDAIHMIVRNLATAAEHAMDHPNPGPPTRRPTGAGLRPIAEFAERSLVEIEELTRRSSFSIRGVATGLDALDELTDGFLPGRVYLVAGTSSEITTALAMNAVAYAAIRAHKLVALLSNETSAAGVMFHLLCLEARIDGRKLRTGRVTAEEWQLIIAKWKEVFNSSILIDDESCYSAALVRESVTKLEHSPDLVVINSLSRMGENRSEEATQLKDLRALAEELQVPLLIGYLLQHEAGNRPRLDHVRRSGALDLYADTVILVNQLEATVKPGVVEVMVAKNRTGPTGTVRYTYSDETLRFEEQ